MAPYIPGNLLGLIGAQSPSADYQLPPMDAASAIGAAPAATAQPTGNTLGQLGTAQQPDMMTPMGAAMAHSKQLANGLGQHSSGNIFRRGGPVTNVLGAIGDAFLVQGGAKPIYGPAMQQRKIGTAMARLGVNPDDSEALQTIYGMDPELGMKVEDQLAQRKDRHRADDFRGAATDLLLGAGNGAGNPPAGTAPGAPGAYERAARADPEKFLTFQGKQLEVTAHQLKAVRDVHGAVMQLLGGAHDQASYDAAKQQAANLFGQFGTDTSAMNLPDQYSPQAIRGLQLQGMDTAHQLNAIARENRLNWDVQDDEIDNAREATGQQLSHQDRMRGQNVTDKRVRDMAGGGGGPKAAGTPKSENALFTDIQRRFNSGQPVTDRERQFAHDYQHRHGGREPQPRGAGRGRGSSTGEGAIIVKPGTNERMILQGGKWVPLK